MRRGGVRAQAVVYRKFFKSAWLSDALLPLIKIGLLHPTRRKTCSRHSTTYRHFDFDRSCRLVPHISASHMPTVGPTLQPSAISSDGLSANEFEAKFLFPHPRLPPRLPKRKQILKARTWRHHDRARMYQNDVSASVESVLKLRCPCPPGSIADIRRGRPGSYSAPS